MGENGFSRNRRLPSGQIVNGLMAHMCSVNGCLEKLREMQRHGELTLGKFEEESKKLQSTLDRMPRRTYGEPFFTTVLGELKSIKSRLGAANGHIGERTKISVKRRRLG